MVCVLSVCLAVSMDGQISGHILSNNDDGIEKRNIVSAFRVSHLTITEESSENNGHSLSLCPNGFSAPALPIELPVSNVEAGANRIGYVFGVYVDEHEI